MVMAMVMVMVMVMAMMMVMAMAMVMVMVMAMAMVMVMVMAMMMVMAMAMVMVMVMVMVMAMAMVMVMVMVMMMMCVCLRKRLRVQLLALTIGAKINERSNTGRGCSHRPSSAASAPLHSFASAAVESARSSSPSSSHRLCFEAGSASALGERWGGGEGSASCCRDIKSSVCNAACSAAGKDAAHEVADSE
jgi:hypothetical protein